MNLPRRGFERLCWNKELRMDQTDAAVWQEVCRLLEDPERLEQEYRQRLLPSGKEAESDGLEAQISKLRRGIARLIDSYAEGLIDKQEFEPRVTRLRERMQHLEEQVQCLKEASEVEEELRLIVSRLETFAARVQDGLQQADFQTRREIIRALVKRVEVDTQQIRIVFRVSPTSLPPSSDDASPNWQHWGRREAARTFHRDMRDLQVFEPVAHAQQVRRHGAKRPPLLVPLAVGIRSASADKHVPLMHVQARTSFIHQVHQSPPVEEWAGTGCPSWGKCSLTCFADAGERQTMVLVGHPGSHCWSGSQREYQTDL